MSFKHPIVDDRSLIQLVYVSQALMGSASGLQMSGILAQARPANARDGISGVLTAVDGRFIQILEGRSDVIAQLIIRLRHDPRHTGLVVLESRTIMDRAFGDWDMVSPRLAPQEVAMLHLLLANGSPSLDDLIPILSQAIRQQEAVLEGQSARPALDTQSASLTSVSGLDVDERSTARPDRLARD